MTDGIDLNALEQRLAPLSHGTEALTILRDTLRRFGAVAARQFFLNEHLLCAPIEYDDVQLRLPGPLEPFHILQGDIVRTDAAYVLGDRQSGNSTYVVATSTCDIVPGRREMAHLLPVVPRRMSDYDDPQRLRNDLANLIAFKTTRYFYLPPLPDDEQDVTFNVVLIDPFAQCSNAALALAERRASMTLIGWRIFGALLRAIQVREADEEVSIRRSALSPGDMG